MDDFAHLTITGADGAARVAVRVLPRAARNAIDGVTEAGALRVRLTAPPVEGAANAALVALLADALDLPKRAVTIVRGEHGREKIVLINATPAQVRERLRAAIAHARR